MRKFLFLGLFSLLMLVACGQKEDAIYIISTNDMHASIDAFPELATLIHSYERRGEVLVVDSGDRVAGNAYVDDAEQDGMPIIELMNAVGYDIVTLGNHEFDKGYDALRTMVEGSEFVWTCANMQTLDEQYPLERYTTHEIIGIKLGFFGIVDTDQKGHPLGKDDVYKEFIFENDVDCAERVAEEIAPEHDFVVLLSHMGLRMDGRLTERNAKINWIAGGHSHDLLCESKNGIHLSQNNKNLRYVTVAKLSVDNGAISGVEYEQVNLSTIEEDRDIRELVDRIKLSDPKLNEVIATANEEFSHDGVANLTIDALMNYPYHDGFQPEVCFYHFGGVRLSSLAKGDVRLVDILNNDPFLSTIYLGEMTASDIRKFILDKYNSGTPEQPDKESHYVYFRSNIPYQIILGNEPAEYPDAIDIKFDLEEGHLYRVAMCNYIAESYIDKELVARQLWDSNTLVREAMLHYVENLESGLTPNNVSLQTEVKSE
ncbi:MAG: 5'-nucleotidase C-terminal domain-containing protein [Alistipes sp.]|nr:5'-nucleotidase C-terminal domain-containing protein [Alistipes sp.]